MMITICNLKYNIVFILLLENNLLLLCLSLGTLYHLYYYDITLKLPFLIFVNKTKFIFICLLIL